MLSTSVASLDRATIAHKVALTLAPLLDDVPEGCTRPSG